MDEPTWVQEFPAGTKLVCRTCGEPVYETLVELKRGTTLVPSQLRAVDGHEPQMHEAAFCPKCKVPTPVLPEPDYELLKAGKR